MRLLAALIACGLLLSPRGFAAPPEPPIVLDQAMSKWTVNEDNTWVVDAEVSIRAPDNNVTRVVRVPLTWLGSSERLQVVQARIDKPDGRSVVMPPEAVRDSPPTGDAYFHEFSDERRLLITFSGAWPGDLLVVHTRREVFRPRVPGGFMAAPILDRSVGWEETNYTISLPKDMPFAYEMRGFDHQSELIKERMVHYFHSPKIVPPAREVVVTGDFDRLPRFAVSTFRDYNQFARAYSSVLLPHAKVTPAITAMAARLTEGQQSPADQAHALYLWVRDHVQFVPIPLDLSHPEPNDAEQVMTKLYGDNKDQVVLLYALLAARQIPAEIVLLNASDDATIADPPNERPMDHLILFLPSLKLYVDPSLGVAPFGQLSFSELGKPAIHLADTLTGARDAIPVPPSGANRSNMKTDMVFAADGGVTGTTTTTAQGALGIWLRDVARGFGENTSAAAITLLREHATPGTGNFSFDPPTSPGEEYTVHGTFQLQNQSALLHTGFFSLWTGLRILPRPGDVLAGPMYLRNLPKNQTTFCYPGVQSEELSITIPAGREVGGVPEDTKIDTDLIRYRSHWTMDGQRITVAREFQSLAPGPTCEGEVRKQMADVLARVRDDLAATIGIKQEIPPPPAANAETKQ